LPVVDASVAAKWVLSEADSDTARSLLQGVGPLAAPSVADIEVTAAILRRHRVGELDRFDALDAIDTWRGLVASDAIILSPDLADWEHAISLAVEIAHGFQDCLYLALARRLGDELVTADRRFAARARRVHRRTRLIGAAG
jgi:hypothetical protein